MLLASASGVTWLYMVERWLLATSHIQEAAAVPVWQAQRHSLTLIAPCSHLCLTKGPWRALLAEPEFYQIPKVKLNQHRTDGQKCRAPETTQKGSLSGGDINAAYRQAANVCDSLVEEGPDFLSISLHSLHHISAQGFSQRTSSTATAVANWLSFSSLWSAEE